MQVRLIRLIQAKETVTSLLVEADAHYLGLLQEVERFELILQCVQLQLTARLIEMISRFLLD